MDVILNKTPHYIPGVKYFKYILIILAAAIIARADMFVYQWALQKGKLDGWKVMTQSNVEVPKGKFINEIYIIYELEGTLSEKKPQSIVLKKDNVIKEFPTRGTRFTVVKPYASFARWPSKIIKEYQSDNFAVGDAITLLFESTYKEGFHEEPTRILKVQNE